MNNDKIRFNKSNSPPFYRILNKRVNAYFSDHNIKKTGNFRLHVKTLIMLSLFVSPYFTILFASIPGWAMLGLCAVMGAGMAGIGVNVMHDGNHNSYSDKKWVNKIMGGSMYFLAGNVYNWQVQHNILHHTYTNIHGYDEDINSGGVFRFSEHSKWSPFHRFQHIYSTLFYGLLTVNWVTTDDFKQTKRYLKRKLSYGKFPNPAAQWASVIISKILYLIIWIVIPLLVLDAPWYFILLGFFIMHFVAGMMLSIIFQLAHILEDTETPLPDESGSMNNSWAIHQLFTTTNFGTKNRFLSWLSGGLNHQVEHHIFPHISHIHYPEISKIIKQTAREFDLPYNEYETMSSALVAHFKQLKHLGAKPRSFTS